MTWIRLDDHFADHPKIVAAGPIAAIVHIRALCYASRYLTDGWIPDGILSALFTGFDDLRLKVDDVPEILVREGLWEKATGGYSIHDYLKYNPSKSTVLKARQKDSDRKKEGIQTDSIRKSKRIPSGIQPSPSPSSLSLNSFSSLWSLLPKGSKKDALKEYKAAKDIPGNVCETLTLQLDYKAECDRRGVFCAELQDLHRWIKKRRWEDVVPEVPLTQTERLWAEGQAQEERDRES